MARCYHCGKVLEDAWLKRQGAALMGKASGERKARSPELARKAALARWERTRQPESPQPPEPPPKKRRKNKIS
jgi:hypothetical protein